eukprot:5258020-Amphidinium_carterae.1
MVNTQLSLNNICIQCAGFAHAVLSSSAKSFAQYVVAFDPAGLVQSRTVGTISLSIVWSCPAASNSG